MDLQISVFLLFIIFTGGHSLSCYQCTSLLGSCNQTNQCPTGSTNCFRATFILNSNTVKVKSCAAGCPNGSIDLGAGQVDPMCCNTDLCNAQDAPVSTNSPNGKMCYYCDGQSCSKKLNCSGSEDRCVTATGTLEGQSLVVKGCVSNSVCDAPNFIPNVNSISCCEGNLCNGVNSVTLSATQSYTQGTTQSLSSTQSAKGSQSFLFLCCSLLSFILLH